MDELQKCLFVIPRADGTYQAKILLRSPGRLPDLDGSEWLFEMPNGEVRLDRGEVEWVTMNYASMTLRPASRRGAAILAFAARTSGAPFYPQSVIVRWPDGRTGRYEATTIDKVYERALGIPTG